MNSGLVDPNAGPVRFSSRISRNLNSGDRIYLVVGATTGNIAVKGVVRYALLFNKRNLNSKNKGCWPAFGRARCP